MSAHAAEAGAAVEGPLALARSLPGIWTRHVTNGSFWGASDAMVHLVIGLHVAAALDGCCVKRHDM